MRKSSKRLMALLVVLVMIFSVVPVYGAENLNVSLNSINITVNGVKAAVTGESYTVDEDTVVPYSIMYKGTTYLPMRKVCELTGNEVKWTAAIKQALITKAEKPVAPAATTAEAIDGTKEVIAATLNGVNIGINNGIEATSGEFYMLADGTKVPYSILYKGTTYLPMRYVSNLVGKDIDWDQTTKTATITDMKQPAGYADYKEAPDFGAVCGQAPVATEKVEKAMEDGSTMQGTIYFYEGTEAAFASIDKYKAALYLADFYILSSDSEESKGVKVTTNAYVREAGTAVSLGVASNSTKSQIYVKVYNL